MTMQTIRYKWNGGVDPLAIANEVDPTAAVINVQPNYVDVEVDDGVSGVLDTMDEVMRSYGFVANPVAPPETLTPRQLESRIVNATGPLNGEDELIQISPALAAPIVLTLPLAASQPAGKLLVVKDVGGALTVVNTCQIATAGADTIDGAAAITLNIAFQSRTLCSDGVSRWALTAAVL